VLRTVVRALGKKIDRTAAYLRTQQRNNDGGQLW
jgi:hypothetical protein